MKQLLRGAASVVLLACGLVLSVACDDSNSIPAGTGPSSGTAGTCTEPTKADYCKSCTFPASASPNACTKARNVNACCAWVQEPTQELTRGTGLNRYSSDDPTIQLGCLDAPAPLGTSKLVTLKGYVRLFSSGNDSAGVKVEIYKEGPDGALGELVGTPAVTTDDDAVSPPKEPKPDWLKKCPDGGCTFRAYTYAGVPTETPLIVKTSDAAGGQQWAALYDYNVYFSSASASASDEIEYEPAAVAATDINTVASAAGGFTVRQDRGLLAGEVHDCADVRLSGATVDTDVQHEGDMFYFGENESDPLPDKSRGALGTSKLGLWGTLNVATGVPIRVSAVGKLRGETVLLETYIVQAFPGAITAINLRGRRPWQQ